MSFFRWYKERVGDFDCDNILLFWYFVILLFDFNIFLENGLYEDKSYMQSF